SPSKLETSVALCCVTKLHILEWPFIVPKSVRCARVLVTGASTGIGEQVAYHYAKMGAQVVITARREYALQKVAANCTSLGAQKALYDVLNHIGSTPFAMWKGDGDHIRELMQLNFLSYVNMASAALPVLEQSAGSMIVVSSLLGEYTSHTRAVLQGGMGKNVSLSMCKTDRDIPQATYSCNRSKRGYTNMAYPANDAALHIIKAGATHQKESFYPGYIYFACLCRDWFPFFRDIITQNSYTY
uniref:Uncharacterized protein n=1 Tax=Oncorhynchus tshawytscha TaxID=74940 RepID=A0A8C8FCD2_ONCTS